MYLKAQAQWRCLSESSDFITPDLNLKPLPALTGSAVRADLQMNYVEALACLLYMFQGIWGLH